MVTRQPSAAERARAARARAPRAPAPSPRPRPWSTFQKAWRAVGQRVPELRDELRLLAAVQMGRVRLAGSQMVMGLVARIAMAVVLLVVFLIALSMGIDGIAGGIAVALEGKVWLANI